MTARLRGLRRRLSLDIKLGGRRRSVVVIPELRGFVMRADGLTPMRRAYPNSSLLQRASALQLLGNLGSYVSADSGSLVVDDTGAYVYSEA